MDTVSIERTLHCWEQRSVKLAIERDDNREFKFIPRLTSAHEKDWKKTWPYICIGLAPVASILTVLRLSSLIFQHPLSTNPLISTTIVTNASHLKLNDYSRVASLTQSELLPSRATSSRSLEKCRRNDEITKFQTNSEPNDRTLWSNGETLVALAISSGRCRCLRSSEKRASPQAVPTPKPILLSRHRDAL